MSLSAALAAHFDSPGSSHRFCSSACSSRPVSFKKDGDTTFCESLNHTATLLDEMIHDIPCLVIGHRSLLPNSCQSFCVWTLADRDRSHSPIHSSWSRHCLLKDRTDWVKSSHRSSVLSSRSHLELGLLEVDSSSSRWLRSSRSVSHILSSRVGFPDLQVWLVIGLPFLLHLIRRKILLRIDWKNTPLCWKRPTGWTGGLMLLNFWPFMISPIEPR